MIVAPADECTPQQPSPGNGDTLLANRYLARKKGKRQRRCLWRFTLTSPPGYPDHRLTLWRRQFKPRIAPPFSSSVSAGDGSSACAVSPLVGAPARHFRFPRCTALQIAFPQGLGLPRYLRDRPFRAPLARFPRLTSCGVALGLTTGFPDSPAPWPAHWLFSESPRSTPPVRVASFHRARFPLAASPGSRSSGLWVSPGTRFSGASCGRSSGCPESCLWRRRRCWLGFPPPHPPVELPRTSCGLLRAPALATGSSMTPLRGELCILGKTADESSPRKGPRFFRPDPGCRLNLYPDFCCWQAGRKPPNSFDPASSLQAESALPGSFEPSIEMEFALVPIRAQL